MVDKHSQSFFGKSSGLTIQSSSKNEAFVFLKCIKKKGDGIWEKPSKGEGKTIKCSLDEIVMILEVLHKRLENWSSYHNFNDIKTQISFKWENEKKEILYVNIGSYSKMLKFSQIEILRLLLNHMLSEKIEFATTSNFSEEQNGKQRAIKKTRSYEKKEQGSNSSVPSIRENIEVSEKPSCQIEGAIKNETQKALLITFQNDREYWIPKSAIRSSYVSHQENQQSFIIDTWLLEKNDLVSY
ncbi:MAG: hypothetical protein KGD73_11365 [Candidatus Lokiarchaeota archaeon]|nr:hypothetical protein [Candidatus Lokiarchaeota archaeon]